jgi:hypothetical protein
MKIQIGPRIPRVESTVLKPVAAVSSEAQVAGPPVSLRQRAVALNAVAQPPTAEGKLEVGRRFLEILRKGSQDGGRDYNLPQTLINYHPSSLATAVEMTKHAQLKRTAALFGKNKLGVPPDLRPLVTTMLGKPAALPAPAAPLEHIARITDLPEELRTFKFKDLGGGTLTIGDDGNATFTGIITIGNTGGSRKTISFKWPETHTHPFLSQTWAGDAFANHGRLVTKQAEVLRGSRLQGSLESLPKSVRTLELEEKTDRRRIRSFELVANDRVIDPQHWARKVGPIKELIDPNLRPLMRLYNNFLNAQLLASQHAAAIEKPPTLDSHLLAAIGQVNDGDVVSRPGAIAALLDLVTQHVYPDAIAELVLNELHLHDLKRVTPLDEADVALGGVQAKAWRDERPVSERLRADANTAMSLETAQKLYPKTAHAFELLRARLSVARTARPEAEARAAALLDLELPGETAPAAREAFRSQLKSWSLP